MQGWLSILIMIALGAGFGLISVLLSSVLGPRHPTPEKSAPYECGMPPVGDARAPIGQVLSRRDDLSPLRHRGRVPVPVGDGAARSRMERLHAGAAVHDAAAGRLRLRLAQGRARLGNVHRSQ